MNIKVDKFLLIAGMMAAPLTIPNCVVENDDDDAAEDGGTGGTGGSDTGGASGAVTGGSGGGAQAGAAGDTSSGGTAGDATVAGAGGQEAVAGNGAGGETVAGGAGPGGAGPGGAGPGGAGPGGAGGTGPCLGDGNVAGAGGVPVAPSCEGLPYGMTNCDPSSWDYPTGADICSRYSWQMRVEPFAALYECLAAIADDACSPEHDAAALACLQDVRSRSCPDAESTTICESIVSGCGAVDQGECEAALNSLDPTYRSTPQTCFNYTIVAVGGGGAGGAGGGPSFTCDEVWWDICVEGTASIE